MKKTCTLMIAGMLALSVQVSTAAVKAGEFSLSPMVGGYLFDVDNHVDHNSFVGAIRAGYNFTPRMGVEALFDYANTDTRALYGNKNVDMYRYGAEAIYNMFPDAKLVPHIAVGAGALNLVGGGLSSKAKTMLDYGIGAKYFLTDTMALRGDVRHVITKDSDWKNNLEYTVGAYIPFGGTVAAAKPVEPPPAPALKVVEAPVAPTPAAPTAALTVNPVMVNKGQTASLNWRSQNASECEIQPGGGAVPPQGARAIVPDSSTTYNLTCTGAGGTATSTAAVTVVVPPIAAVERFCNKPAILKINFDVDKSIIKPHYNAELKHVGDFLKQFPKAKGEVSGHTDSTASEAYNQKLSERRAEAVGKYIITTFGIDAGRITTKGYGESKPIATNKSKAGKAQNRRIEANFTCE